MEGFFCLLDLKESSGKPQKFNELAPETLGFMETD